MSPRRLALACLIPLSWLIACDHKDPVAPTLEAGVSSAGGPTVKVPSNTSASAVSESRIDVSWQDNSTNESGFEVHRSTTGPSGTFSLVASTAAGVTSYSNSGLTPSTQYCYEIRAFRTTGSRKNYSAFSNIACATTLPPPLPAAPSGVNAMPSGGSIYLTWVDNATNETGFRVERSATSDGPWTSLGTTGANVVSFQDQQPPPAEQPACYRLFAVNGSGESSSSNVDCTANPAAPSELVATVTGSDVDLTWTDNSGIEDGYRVLRGGNVVATLPANATAYHDAVVPDGSYTYYVFASKDGGSSVLSNEVFVGVLTAPPAAPFDVDASPSSSYRMIITWYEPWGNTAAGHRVQRSSDGGASWSTLGETPQDDASFVDEPVSSEQQFCYRVFAFNSWGDSDPSNTDCATPPAPPTNLQATPADVSGAIDLTWMDNSSVEEGYRVSRVNGIVVATVGPNITSYRDSGLTPGVSYSYYVVAVKDNGESDRSNYASATAP